MLNLFKVNNKDTRMASIDIIQMSLLLILFSPMFHFYTPQKRQKTIGFLTFSGDIEIKHWGKMG